MQPALSARIFDESSMTCARSSRFLPAILVTVFRVLPALPAAAQTGGWVEEIPKAPNPEVRIMATTCAAGSGRAPTKARCAGSESRSVARSFMPQRRLPGV